MRYFLLVSASVLTVIISALPLARTFGQVQNPTEAKAPNEDAKACGGGALDPDVGIEACSRLLDQEVRDSAQRRAIALTFRGMAWKAKGDLKKAVADLTEAIGLDEGFVPAYETRADLLRDNDQCDLALPEYDRVIKLARDRPSAYISRALCLSTKDQLQGAGEDLDRAIKLDANNAGGYAMTALGIKARLDIARNEVDDALKSYDAAIALDPKLPALYLDRGAVLSAKGDQDMALMDYDRATKLDESNVGGFAVAARILKGRLEASRGNFDAAVGEYEQAIKLDPKRISLYLDRARLWNLKGDTDRALTDYSEAIKVDPTNALAFNSRGDLYRNQGDYQHAIADYDQAVEKQPNDLTAFGNRALVRFYQGEFVKAADDLKRVVDAAPNAYPALLLYVTKSRDGDARDAKSDLTKISAKLKAGDWPYPIVEFYLGKQSLRVTEGVAKTPEQRCETQFYIGEWHLLRKDRSEAAKALQAAADTCPKNFVEYRGALEELKRLK
ncbi:Lipoprotein NlpI, contains TPR repeats [Bradyrhizobium lablabi]|uniref:Lipoprotein NlpI, contains TPR repeats n=1 Tax=Bradyrhizobium lablabi TaxID=722472 RepID=A0A1M6XRD7_9BRAD|nr:tetratricopeptide repeat protein [Bradyrhizobium lablabi]SHL08496.1 Lipoprotein NlpI, contains TPR repeats [Bradyrhizobium lablabi]